MAKDNDCCIYCRVSTESQDESIQIPACEQYARELGLNVVEVIQEKISAFKNPDRESIKKLSSYPHIILFDYSRLFRNRIKFIEAMRYFSLRGTKIHSVREGWVEQLHKIPAPFNEILYDLMLQVVGWMAEEESKRRSDRVRLAFQNKEEGLHWGRLPKSIDMERLKESYDPNSLRGTARVYNEIFKGKNRISYVTVKKIIDKNPDIFNKSKCINQGVDCFTGGLSG